MAGDDQFGGEALTVVLGEEKIQVVQYNTMVLPQITLSTRIAEGETATEAYDRTMAVLLAMRKRSFDMIVHGHLDNIADAAKAARS